MAFVQSKLGRDAVGTGSLAVTFDNSVAGGNCIVALFSTYDTQTHDAVTDNQGNTYTKAVDLAVGSNRLSIWTAPNVTGGTVTVTFDPSGTGDIVGVIHEYSGIALANPVEDFASNSGFSASPSSGAVDTAAAGDDLVAAIMFAGAGTSIATTGSGFVQREERTGLDEMETDDALAVAAGNFAETWTLGGNANFVAAIIALLPTPPVSITPAAGALVATGLSPTLVGTTVITPDVGSLAAIGRVPNVDNNINLQPDAGALSADGASPSLLFEVYITPDAGSLAFGGLAPGLFSQVFITPGTGSLSLVGQGRDYLQLTFDILVPVRAPLFVEFDIEGISTVMDPLVVTLDIADTISRGLDITFDIFKAVLIPGGGQPGVSPDVQGPVAQVTIT